MHVASEREGGKPCREVKSDGSEDASLQDPRVCFRAELSKFVACDPKRGDLFVTQAEAEITLGGGPKGC